MDVVLQRSASTAGAKVAIRSPCAPRSEWPLPAPLSARANLPNERTLRFVGISSAPVSAPSFSEVTPTCLSRDGSTMATSTPTGPNRHLNPFQKVWWAGAGTISDRSAHGGVSTTHSSSAQTTDQPSLSSNSTSPRSRSQSTASGCVRSMTSRQSGVAWRRAR